MEILKIILSALAGVLSGGGFLAFLQFMISRKDNKKNDLKEIKEMVDSSAKKEDVDRLAGIVSSLEQRMNENNATNTRDRILRFSDELMRNVWHSKDTFDQTILDCDFYEEYCEQHPGYKNSIAGAAIDYIRKTYQKCLEEHNF